MSEASILRKDGGAGQVVAGLESRQQNGFVYKDYDPKGGPASGGHWAACSRLRLFEFGQLALGG